MSRFRTLAAVISAAVMIATPTARADASGPQPPFIPASAPWLTSVNYYRAIAGLGPVVEDPSLSAGAALHSCYMLANGMSHDEIPGRPGFTSEGDLAGRSSNVAVSSQAGETARRLIELWMTGPFHAVGVLRPQLQRVGFGRCDDPASPHWRSAASLDVVRGLAPPLVRSAPILFPGDGATTSLHRFIAETPNPLGFCGWTGSAGLPVFAMLANPVASDVTASITGPGGPIETCALSEHNSDGVARAVLAGDNVVVAVPRQDLAPGRYAVSMTSGDLQLAWSFTVDPAADVDLPPPAAVALGNSAGLTPIGPVRVADTRESLGGARLQSQQAERMQVAGQFEVPPTARLVSVNVTATAAAGDGYVTLWNCAASRPVVANINFARAATVANAAIVALDAGGGLCAYSNTSVDVVIDVDGYFGDGSPGKFRAVPPTRLLDTRSSTRVDPHRRVTVPIAVVPPTGALAARLTAAVLDVAAVDASADGFVTAWSCDRPQPLAANLNQIAGAVRSNLVVSPVAADTSVCLYASTALDLVVDVVGYVSTDDGALFTATVPFRFLDTRDVDRPSMTGGLGGQLDAGQTLALNIAGARGIPADAVAVVTNIAVVGAAQPGYLTAFPCGIRPATSNVNYEPGAPTSTAAHVPLSPDGKLCIYTQHKVDVIVDVTGWWS